jgi:hypothetical protein
VFHNQCPSWKNFQLSVDSIRIYPRSMGETSRIHPCLRTPQDGELADLLELLQWDTFHIRSPHRCCRRSLPLTHNQQSYDSHWEDGLQQRVEWRQTPNLTRRHAYHEGSGYADRKIGSPNKTLGWARCHKRSNLCHCPSTRLAYDMRGVQKHQTLREWLLTVTNTHFDHQHFTKKQGKVR